METGIIILLSFIFLPFSSNHNFLNVPAQAKLNTVFYKSHSIVRQVNPFQWSLSSLNLSDKNGKTDAVTTLSHAMGRSDYRKSGNASPM